MAIHFTETLQQKFPQGSKRRRALPHVSWIVATILILMFVLLTTRPVFGALIDETASMYATGFSEQRKVFKNPRGLGYIYAFYRDTVGATDNTYYAYHDGNSWTTEQTVWTSQVEMTSVWIYDTGSQLVVYICGSELGDPPAADLFYRRGVIADASATITWDTEQEIDTFASGDGASYPVICRANDGYIWISYRRVDKAAGKNYYSIEVAISTVTNTPTSTDWSLQNDITSSDGAQDDSDMYATVVPLGALHDVTVIYQYDEGATQDIYGRNADWDGSSLTLDTEVDSGMRMDDIFAAVVNSDNDVNVACRAVGAGNHTEWDVSADSFSAYTQVYSSVNHIVLSRRDSTDALYAFYQRSTNVYYKKSTDQGSTWGTEQLLSTGTTPRYLNSEYMDYNGSIHIIWTEDKATDEVHWDRIYFEVATTTIFDPTETETVTETQTSTTSVTISETVTTTETVETITSTETVETSETETASTTETVTTETVTETTVTETQTVETSITTSETETETISTITETETVETSETETVSTTETLTTVTETETVDTSVTTTESTTETISTITETETIDTSITISETETQTISTITSTVTEETSITVSETTTDTIETETSTITEETTQTTSITSTETTLTSETVETITSTETVETSETETETTTETISTITETETVEVSITSVDTTTETVQTITETETVETSLTETDTITATISTITETETIETSLTTTGSITETLTTETSTSTIYTSTSLTVTTETWTGSTTTSTVAGETTTFTEELSSTTFTTITVRTRTVWEGGFAPPGYTWGALFLVLLLIVMIGGVLWGVLKRRR